MNSICDADLQFLKPGKKVSLKSFNAVKSAPVGTIDKENYWKLVGAKAVVVTTSDDNQRALVKFEKELAAFGLESHADEENALWILVSDLKFVCRY